MSCPICGSDKTFITYSGKIRNGAPGCMTETVEPVFKCENCAVIWHKNIVESDTLYQTDTYRESMGEVVSLEEFYAKHDTEILDKLKYTGTAAYRNKICMDIGCGGGGYADYIRGVASKMLLVEPCENFSTQLRAKGYEVFSYAEDALAAHTNKIDVITSFDVIEHVENPLLFLQTIQKLLAPNGVAYIGTPTEYPVLRSLLGTVFDSFVFSVQHPWVFSKRSLELLAEKSGFSDRSVRSYQRYGIGNLIAWLQTNKPKGEATFDFVTSALNACYMSEMAREETAEYFVLELKK